MDAVRRGALVAARWVTLVFVVGVAVQFFLVGAGIFGMKPGLALDDQTSLDPHRDLGNILGIVAIVALVLVLVAWPRRKSLIGWYLLLAVLTELVQHATADAGSRWVGAIHPLSALAIAWLSAWLGYRAFFRKAEASEAAPEGRAVTTA